MLTTAHGLSQIAPPLWPCDPSLGRAVPPEAEDDTAAYSQAAGMRRLTYTRHSATCQVRLLVYTSTIRDDTENCQQNVETMMLQLDVSHMQEYAALSYDKTTNHEDF